MPTSLNPALPAAWYPLCRSFDLRAGQVCRVTLGGEAYAVWRTRQGTVATVAATCCHVGADLSRGLVVGAAIQCPLHHWRYGADGACVHIPGGHAIPGRARQRALVCAEAYGLVFGFLGGMPTFMLPRFEHEVDPLWSQAAVTEIAAPLATLVANSYDGQHFAAVHDRELLEPAQVGREGQHQISIRYQARVAGQRLGDRLMRGIGIDQVDVRIHCWGGSVLQVYNARTANTILVALLPVDASHTRAFVVTALKQRQHGLVGLLQQAQLLVARWFTVAFLRPDLAVVEGIELRPRVLLPGADDCLVAWLRYWQALPRPQPERHTASTPDAAAPVPLARVQPGEELFEQIA